MPIRITLADGHAVVRAALGILLRAEGDMQVVDSIATGAILQIETSTHPDVVVMELALPSIAHGLDAITALRRHIMPPRVLVLTACDSLTSLRQALSAGAVGYVLKRSALPTLLAGIRTVTGGGSYLDSTLTELAAHTLMQRHARNAQQLSDREESVLRGLATGYTMKEIAQQFSLSTKTIETYRMRGLAKLELSDRVALMRYAVAHGWVGSSI